MDCQRNVLMKSTRYVDGMPLLYVICLLMREPITPRRYKIVCKPFAYIVTVLNGGGGFFFGWMGI